jgi:hypothetical protein
MRVCPGWIPVILITLFSSRSVRAAPSGWGRNLPGDEFIPEPIGTVMHAITIRRSPHYVWPWLAQMDSGRAGWYAYDFIDNASHPSAERIIPEFQNIEVGTVLPAIPGIKDVFVVIRCEPEHDLVLSWRSATGTYITAWAFVLEEPKPGLYAPARARACGTWLSALWPAAVGHQVDRSIGAFHHGAQAVARCRSAR